MSNVWFSLERRRSKPKSFLKAYQEQYETAYLICLYFSVIQTTNTKDHKSSWLGEQNSVKGRGFGGSGEECEMIFSSVNRHRFQELKKKSNVLGIMQDLVVNQG